MGMDIYSGDIRERTWWNGSTLAPNASDMGLSPTLGTVFPIFITPTDMDMGCVHVLICYTDRSTK